MHFNPFLGTFNPGGIFRNFEDTGIIAYRHDITTMLFCRDYNRIDNSAQWIRTYLTGGIPAFAKAVWIFFGPTTENRNDRFTSWKPYTSRACWGSIWLNPKIPKPQEVSLDVGWVIVGTALFWFRPVFFQGTGRISKGTTARSNHVSSNGWSL